MNNAGKHFECKRLFKFKDLILQGDVWTCLDLITDNSIAVVITSPPYWKQRDYKFDGQIGQENTPEEYIGRLVTVFDKLKQKLRNDGVFFLNVGDKYLSRYGKSHLLQIPYRLAYHLLKNGWRLEDIIIWCINQIIYLPRLRIDSLIVTNPYLYYQRVKPINIKRN